MKEYVIGIDLGTSNSAVAIVENGKPVVLVNDEGKRVTPSVVSFAKDSRKVGDPAKRQSIMHPKETINSVKRLMGKGFDSPSVKDEIKMLSYDVVNGGNNVPNIKIGEKKYAPQEISAIILQKMKRIAEEYTGSEIKKAVITVPAYFNDAERTATMEAGKIAGLEVLRIINEPTAAALAYGVNIEEKDAKIVVFDTGGGTHDVSVLDIGDGVFQVLSTAGDVHLGGDDIDHRVVEWILNEFKEESGIDLTGNEMAMQRLKEAAEKAKIELSSAPQTEINLPYIAASDDNVPLHFVRSLSKVKFESLIEDIADRAIKSCEESLKQSKLKVSDIDEVLLVGGTTRIPLFQKKLEDFFKRKLNKSLNPDEAVALGAALQGATLAGDIDDILLLDVIPLSLGIETMGGLTTWILEANTTIPASRSETFSTATDNQPGVEIRVLQGERPMAADNKDLGLFHLEGIMPAPRGIPKIEVTFDVDVNGVLNVKAIDKATNKENSIRVEGSSQLSDHEIERMRKDAESNMESDKKIREKTETINQGEFKIFQTEKQLTDLSENLSEEEKTEVNSLLDALKEDVKKEDIESIKAGISKIDSTMSAIGSKAYGADPSTIFDFNMPSEGTQ